MQASKPSKLCLQRFLPPAFAQVAISQTCFDALQPHTLSATAVSETTELKQLQSQSDEVVNNTRQRDTCTNQPLHNLPQLEPHQPLPTVCRPSQTHPAVGPCSGAQNRGLTHSNHRVAPCCTSKHLLSQGSWECHHTCRLVGTRVSPFGLIETRNQAYKSQIVRTAATKVNRPSQTPVRKMHSTAVTPALLLVV